MKNLILSILTSAALLIPSAAFAAPLTSDAEFGPTISNMAVCAMPDDAADFDLALLGDATFNVALADLVGSYQVFSGDTITIQAQDFTISHDVHTLPPVCLAALTDEVGLAMLNFSINNGDWLLSYSGVGQSVAIADLEASGGEYVFSIPQLVLTYMGDYADFVDASLILTLTGNITIDIDSDAPINDGGTVINGNL